MKYLLIGLDDIDSYAGGCTTHFATYIVEKIIDSGGYLTDYPRLIRLNPDTPWRTRGNGAVAIEAMLPRSKISPLLDWLERSLHEYIILNNGLRPGTQPGIVVLDGSKITRETYEKLNQFSSEALYRIISHYELESLISYIGRHVIKIIAPYGRRGLIGSLAAIGNYLPHDYTYELLVYRKLVIRDRDRDINISPSLNWEDEYTFAHVDLERKNILWTPHGPDPVILGIRGDRISKVIKIFRGIERYLSYDRWIIYVTNQGTNEHFKRLIHNQGQSIEAFNQYIGVFKLSSNPFRDKGGHLHSNAVVNGNSVEVLVYEPSARLREVLDTLKKGDKVILGGVFKPSRYHTNLLFNTQIISFCSVPIYRESDVKPICPSCGTRMESLGRASGYECEKCRYHIKKPHTSKIHRSMWIPHLSLPPYRSIRHLSKPLKRYGREHRHRVKGFRSRVWFYFRN